MEHRERYALRGNTPKRAYKTNFVDRWSFKIENVYICLHLTSNWSDNGSEDPTEFCAWHVYKPASRRPTGRNCSVS